MEIKHTYKILVVDDEPDIVELLQYNLERAGYEVRTASNGQEAIDESKTFLPNLILMDIMMPRMDGVETSRLLREIPELSETYIIFLTARVEEYSEVAAFDVGADDYIIKPIKPRALISRISAMFRRELKKNRQEDKISVGDLTIDKRSYTVFKGFNPITLPKKEFELLFFLAQNPNKVFSGKICCIISGVLMYMY